MTEYFIPPKNHTITISNLICLKGNAIMIVVTNETNDKQAIREVFIESPVELKPEHRAGYFKGIIDQMVKVVE